MDLTGLCAVCAAMASQKELLCKFCSEMLLLDLFPERDARNMYSHASRIKALIPF